MHKLISASMLLAVSSVSLNAFGAENKVDLCHNYRMISVAESAVSAHLNHGDRLDSCPDRPDKPDDDDDDNTTAVVMLRCDMASGLVVSVNSSPSGVWTMPTDAVCAEALAGLLDIDFHLRSVTSAGDDLNDYLLVGETDDDDDDDS